MPDMPPLVLKDCYKVKDGLYAHYIYADRNRFRHGTE
jgi:hypothetical protein